VLHLKRLYRLLYTLKRLLSNWQQPNTTEVMTVDDLLSKLGGKLEEINFLEIQTYLRKSKVWCCPPFVVWRYLSMHCSWQGKSQRTRRRRSQRVDKKVCGNGPPHFLAE
jgi:hypothetical protein